MIRSRTPTTETDLNIFRIIYSTLINLDVHQTEGRKPDGAMGAALQGWVAPMTATSGCSGVQALLATYLGFSFANASFTRGVKGESGASFKYFSYSFAISSSLPFPVSACATIRCEIANCLWSGREDTLRALVRARSVSPFCS